MIPLIENVDRLFYNEVSTALSKPRKWISAAAELEEWQLEIQQPAEWHLHLHTA